MDFRAQAALEYLMTYGWALVIIVTVASVLFFIMSSPASGVTCNSSDPAELPVQSSNVPSTSPGTIRVINGTAGRITYLGCAGPATNNSFALCAGPTAGTTFNGGAVISFAPTHTSGATALDTNTGITMYYTDQFNYTKQVRITCSGTKK